MIGRFVKQEQIGIVKHSSRQLKFHLPSSGEPANGISLTFVIETDLNELIADLGPWDTIQLGICRDTDQRGDQIWER